MDRTCETCGRVKIPDACTSDHPCPAGTDCDDWWPQSRATGERIREALAGEDEAARLRAENARLREALQQLLGEVAELGYDREDEERAYRDEEEAERGEHPDVLIGTIPWEGIWKARVVLAAPTDPPAAGDPGKCGGGGKAP